jgi:hypothetical protein
MQDMKHKIDEEVLNKIIAAAYKDGGLVERIKVHLLSKKYPEVKRIFDEYRATAEKIKNVPLDKCPGSVVESIQTKTANQNKFFILKPAYIFAAAFLVVTITASLIWFKSKEEKPVYTKAEIELAEEQVKESLAIVNKVFKKTENLIQDEVLPERVGKPIRKSLTIINDVLIGG